MRNQKNFKRIAIEEEVYDRIVNDKKHFQEVIGGGKWSMSDTIREYHKILNMIKDEN